MSRVLWDAVREGCGSCEYGKRSTRKAANNEVVVNVECRRYPPTMVQTIEKSLYDNIQYDVNQFSPTMAEHDWCGEWKRKQKAPNEA